MSELRLDGLTVIVARDDAPDDDVSRSIVAAGGAVVPLPLMRIEPIVVADLAARIAALADTDVIALTSRHAAAALTTACATPPRAIVAAVGATTAAVLEAAGWDVDVVGSSGGRALATAIIARAPKRVVWPRAVEAHDALRAVLVDAGIGVEAIDVYRSVVVADPEAALQAMRCARPAALVLTSPARAQALVDLVAVPADIAVVAVGATTASACTAVGLVVAAVAESPGAAPLGAALASVHHPS